MSNPADVIALNLGLYSKKYWKFLMIATLGTLFFLISVSSVIVGVILPSDNFSSVIEPYKTIAGDVGISWVELLAFDTVQKENDLRTSSYNDVMNTALMFCNLEVVQYELDKNMGTHTSSVKNNYTGSDIKTILSTLGNSSSNKVNFNVNAKDNAISNGNIKVNSNTIENSHGNHNAIGNLNVNNIAIGNISPNGISKFLDIKNAVTSIDALDNYDALLSYKSFEEVISSLAPDKKEWALALIDTGGIQQIYGISGFEKIDLSQLHFPPGGAKIPHFLQSNWSNVPYGSYGTIASGGCGPTSLAMIVVGLKEITDVTPATVGNWSVEKGYRVSDGSSWELMTEGGKKFGLSVETISRKNPKRIAEELSKGNPIIASMQNGHFTKNGHFIVLRGITKEGKILVNDSNSTKNTNTEWDLSIIMNESSSLGGEDGSPFWVYKSLSNQQRY